MVRNPYISYEPMKCYLQFYISLNLLINAFEDFASVKMRRLILSLLMFLYRAYLGHTIASGLHYRAMSLKSSLHAARPPYNASSLIGNTLFERQELECPLDFVRWIIRASDDLS